jgi:hypothetical protein
MSEATKPVLIRVNMSGYKGAAVSIFAAFDPRTSVLSAAREHPKLEEADRPGFLRISNQVDDPHRDALFNEDELSDAIRAYHDMRAGGRLVMAPALQRHDPSNRIEADGVDERGTKYRISSDITAGQVAILAACWYARRQSGLQAQKLMIAEMKAMRIITV